MATAGGCGSETDTGEDGGAGTVVPDEPPTFDRDAGKPCTGFCLQQTTCPGGGTTTLTGTVRDPAGKVPLYNVLVYVPNAPVEPLARGAACDRCGSVSGDPLVTTLTDAKGEFRLDDVPVGRDIPLVLQIGKWRRQLVVPSVTPCVANALPDAALRLPRNKAEGDIPQMAIATGEADPFECLLTKMGLDLAEFTPDTGAGRVHVFRENGVDTSPSAPAASTLYGDVAKLNGYDLVFLPCEGSERDKAPGADDALVAYTSGGGRVFTTHFGYAWLAPNLGAAPFQASGAWEPKQSDVGDDALLTARIEQGFPKGKAFAEWLVNVGASQKLGELALKESRHDLNAGKDPPSTTWMTTAGFPAPNPNAALHITFNTPVGEPEAAQCGKVVFSDFHVSAEAQNSGQTFPASCKTGDLSAQEKALEFMLFDLSSCIQSDKAKPTPPAVK
jgi:hypothetical protein